MQAGLQVYLDSLEIHPPVLDAARELDVSERVLRLAYAAEWWLHACTQFRGPVEDEGVRASLAALAAEGGAGFLAVVALIRGQGTGQHIPAMVEATWQPGQEKHLFETIDRGLPQRGAVHRVYTALGVIDTNEVRRYLRAALEKHAHESVNFTAVASALGRLEDGDSLDAIAAALDKPTWGSMRPVLLTAIGDLGGDEAKRTLLQYLAQPQAGSESFAIRALAKIDLPLAREKAQEYLTRPKASPIERQRVRAFLAETG